MTHNKDFKDFLLKIWDEYETTNAIHKSTPILCWEAAKASIQGKTIVCTTAYKKAIISTFKQTSQRLRTAQLSDQANPTTERRQMWMTAKTAFDLSKKNYQVTQKEALDLKYHLHGNKAGKLLAHLTKETFKPTVIPKIRNTQGTLHTEEDKINKVFMDYYTLLYSKTQADTQKGREFLEKIPLSTLTEEQLTKLNDPITVGEVSKIIQLL